ncbi:MAG TPA: protein kinase [Vicinamibacterales bacterium]|nr:protein kinase [Vicinamibacterales bacterium]
MSLAAGTRLGPYEIVAPLGAGGMGEVYRAHDSRLGREVAVKVLPASFAADADRLRRFEQEARAIGALNHANIVAVYDIGTHDGAPYVVSELLDGETLRTRVGDSPLPRRKAIDYAVQIARGLAAAHEKGIIHRDLKPDNVFVTRDGRVKILDFGLAKMTEASSVDSATALMRDAPETGAGTVLGTVGYMSPEQVRGQRVDHRSDIFSFGVVLYEMLTGRRAFQGDSAVETMNAILKSDPAPAETSGASLPPALDRVVLHCLEKGPEERFQSARDIAFDLEALAGASSQTSAQPVATERPRWLKPVILTLLAAAGGAALFAAGRSTGRPPSNPVLEPLTFRRGDISTARFGPDGRAIIYAARWEGGPLELYSAQPGSPESRAIGLQADLQAVSKHGEMAVLLNRPGGGTVLARMPIGGGAPREVLEQVQSADWGPDGDSLAVVHTVGGRDRVEFPIGTVLYQARGWLSDLAVSPKGDRIAFAEHPVAIDNRGDVAVIDLKGNRTTISGGWEDIFGVHWTPAGDEVWFSASGGGGKAAGTDHAVFAATVAGSVRTVMSAPGSLDVQDIAADGRVLLAHGNRRPSIMALASGAKDETELTWMDFSWISDISPDGRQILFSEQGVGGGAGYATYLRGTDRSPAVRLGKGMSQYLSPDGRWALAIDLVQNRLAILPTGPGEPRTLPPGAIKAYSFAGWFPDGERVLFAGFEEGKAFRMYVQDLKGGDPRPVTPEGVAVRSDTLSPDGKWIAATLDGRPARFPVDGGDPQPIAGGEPQDTAIRWRGDGRALFVRNGRLPAKILSIDVATGQRTLVHEIAPRDTVGVANIGDIRLTPDGKAYAYVYIRSLFSLYQVTGLK